MRKPRETIIFALLIAQCYGETCGVYDGEGNALGLIPHRMGTVRRDVKPGSALPGELIFKNMQPVSLNMKNCDLDVDLNGNRLRFRSKKHFGNQNDCTFTVTAAIEDGCPASTPKDYTVSYEVQDAGEGRLFDRENYEFQATFPVAKGARIGEAVIELSNSGFSTRIELEDDFDGMMEIVSIESNRNSVSRFELRATRLLYLLEDLNLTMIAKNDFLSSKAGLTIRMSEDSAMPRPEFEESFYVVRLNSSDLNSNRDVYPPGIIRLKEDYRRLSFDLQSLSDSELQFLIDQEDFQTVSVRLAEETPKNLSSREVVLQLIARVSDQFGREIEGFTTLLIKVEGNQTCMSVESPVIYEADNKEHLTIAVIVLSVTVVILIMIIIFLYFKYVCVKKPEPTVPCKKCSAPATVKTRRPTPRKISEYPYPLDVLPPPLETLAETEVEEEGGNLEVKVTKPKDELPSLPSTSGVKTRKRSMTFRESDEEARHFREGTPEVIVHKSERKISNERKLSNVSKSSNESQRRMSVEEERRRRKSSVKMYRCLT